MVKYDQAAAIQTNQRLDYVEKKKEKKRLTDDEADKKQLTLRHASKNKIDKARYRTAKGFKKSEKSKEIVAHPERHLAVISQQGHIKDKAAQELLQHGGTKVPAE